MGNEGAEGAKKTEGPACASPPDQSFALQGRDVRGDFHRDGDDLGLGLGPLHFSSSERVVERTDDWVLPPSRIVGGPDDARSNAGGVPQCSAWSILA